MPKDPHSKQQFGSVGSPASWDATSTDPEAGKVHIVGGSIDGMDFNGPLDGKTALVESLTFSATTSTWATLVAFTSSERGELRIWRAGNTSGTITRLQFRWASRTAFLDQPLAANGGAMNENGIGAYDRAPADGEDLQFRVATAVSSVVGGVKTRPVI